MRGNPHAAFDAAGAGNVAWSRWCDTRRRKSEPTGNTNFDLNRRASPRPYRIAPSALAPDVPEADLYVTQAHGVFVDDVLISAGYLVNETTITLCKMSELSKLEFFHIKLETHDVIYAEGAPVESLLNVEESAINFADYFRMHGMPTGDETPCVPFLSNWRRGGLRSRLSSAMSWNDERRRIAAIRNRLKQRAVALSQELEPAI